MAADYRPKHTDRKRPRTIESKGEDEGTFKRRRRSARIRQIVHDREETSKLKTLKIQNSRKRHYEDEPALITKRPRYSTKSRVLPSGRERSIEEWVNESCQTQRSLKHDTKQVQEVLFNMAQRPQQGLPSPRDSLGGTSTTISKRSERSTASIHDPDYRKSMRYRNIYVERENVPLELLQQAHRIISRPRASPEIDDSAIQVFQSKSRAAQDDGEDEIVQQLALDLIPAMNTILDSRLARNANQVWSDAVPLPLDPEVLTNPLPLPKPKPDLAFGYSESAFDNKQLTTIDLLVDDKFGRSYATPDQKLHFPFLTVEFKSQAKGGTHYAATNQVAGAGAIAINGHLELMQRSQSTMPYDEPQFFSVTLDHQLACVNVHWLKPPTNGRPHSFHVEGVEAHLLKDPKGIRAVIRGIKNILDYGVDTRLQSLCAALEVYRASVVQNREIALTHATQPADIPDPPPRPRQETARKATSANQMKSNKARRSAAVSNLADHIDAVPLQLQTSTPRVATSLKRSHEPSHQDSEHAVKPEKAIPQTRTRTTRSATKVPPVEVTAQGPNAQTN